MAIAAALEAHGYPPTIRELGPVLGLRSTNGVNDHLRALEKKGFIARERLRSRTLSITEAGRAELARAGR